MQPQRATAGKQVDGSQAAANDQRVVAVDVEQRRWDVAEKALDRFAGDHDPSALARMGQALRDRLDLFVYVVKSLPFDDERKRQNMLAWARAKKLGYVKAQKPFEDAVQNLTRTVERPSVLDRLFKRD